MHWSEHDHRPQPERNRVAGGSGTPVPVDRVDRAFTPGRILGGAVRRGLPQVVGVYLASSWALIEFSAWAEAQYALRAPLASIVFALLAALLPPTMWLAWRLGAGPRRPRRLDAPRASVAVLPFTALGDDEPAESFGFGLADQIVTDLGRLGDLRVVARGSSFGAGGSGGDIRHVGRRLGARAVLEGCVHLAGDRLRVTTQLVDAENGYQLWSERYDRTLGDLFAVEDEIAEHVARALHTVLQERGRGATMRPPPPGTTMPLTAVATSRRHRT